jgi:hypothetical protein
LSKAGRASQQNQTANNAYISRAIHVSLKFTADVGDFSVK